MVAEQRCGRRPAVHSPSTVEAAVGSCCVGSNRKPWACPCAFVAYPLVVHLGSRVTDGRAIAPTPDTRAALARRAAPPQHGGVREWPTKARPRRGRPQAAASATVTLSPPELCSSRSQRGACGNRCGRHARARPAGGRSGWRADRVLVREEPGFERAPGRLARGARDELAERVPWPPRLGNPPAFASLVLEIIRNEMVNGSAVRIDGALRMPYYRMS
jgi:hypothetical protein